MDDDMPYDEIIDEHEINLSTLIELLKKKGIFTQEEFDSKLDELYPDEE